MANLAPPKKYSIIICTTVLLRKEERFIIKNQVSRYTTGISSFCHSMTDSDLSCDKCILWGRNVLMAHIKIGNFPYFIMSKYKSCLAWESAALPIF